MADVVAIEVVVDEEAEGDEAGEEPREIIGGQGWINTKRWFIWHGRIVRSSYGTAQYPG